MGWDDSLAAMIDADPKTRDSIWQGVSLALAALGRVSQPVRWLAGRLGGCRVLVCCLMPSGLGSNR